MCGEEVGALTACHQPEGHRQAVPAELSESLLSFVHTRTAANAMNNRQRRRPSPGLTVL
jgi:hypothetical protein